MRSIDCFLGKKIEVTDSQTGNDETHIKWSEDCIFCQFESISYKEFYQAQTSDFKPEMNLRISSFDYKNEEYVRYEDEDYTIMKTYMIKDNPDEILLTCTRGIRDVGA